MSTHRRSENCNQRTDRRIVIVAGMVLCVLAIVGCSSTYRGMSGEEKREYLFELEEQTLAELVKDDPKAQADLDAAVGYAIFSNTATKVPSSAPAMGSAWWSTPRPMIGPTSRSSRFDVGGGLGLRKFRLVMIFFDEAAFEKLATGKLELGAGVEAGAGNNDIGTGAGGIAGARNEKRVLYQISDKECRPPSPCG